MKIVHYFIYKINTACGLVCLKKAAEVIDKASGEPNKKKSCSCLQVQTSKRNWLKQKCLT